GPESYPFVSSLELTIAPSWGCVLRCWGWIVSHSENDLRVLRYVRFVYDTGMRSGAAMQITWDMIDADLTEMQIPGNILKNKDDLILPLVDKKGTPKTTIQEALAGART